MARIFDGGDLMKNREFTEGKMVALRRFLIDSTWIKWISINFFKFKFLNSFNFDGGDLMKNREFTEGKMVALGVF